MTLREATEAGVLMRPVICDGIEYRRITICGYAFDDHGHRSDVVQLKDKHANSVTWANAAKVELKGGEWE